MNTELVLMTAQQARELNPLVLAYIGDAVYEVFIRESLIHSMDVNAKTLHLQAVKYVSAVGQSRSAESVIPLLDEDELAIYRRGRNSKSSTMPKSAAVLEYRRATGLESVFGYLYLTGYHERLRMLLGVSAQAQEQ